MAAELVDSKAESLPRQRPRPARIRILRNSGAVFGAVVLIAIVLVAIFARVLVTEAPDHTDISKRLVPPVWHETGTWEHPLGTDRLGRDYLSRLVYGAQTSLLIGSVAVLMSASIGITLGMLAGFFGGRLDTFVTFLVTTRLAMPVILVALSVVALVGGSLTVLILVLGLLLWDRFAVVARAATREAQSRDYVAAARAVGCSTPYIMIFEILPNIAPPLIVVATLEMAQATLLEAGLSFLGLGVQPPLSSWGLMISEGREYMFFSPWVIFIPGLSLFILVFCINLVGDGVRDLVGPESRI
ncbi:MAG: ABC transporter permease [Rhizobiaceae bacterium]|nr:ABC transporter permease [Rhizobiaceae bacterium]